MSIVSKGQPSHFFSGGRAVVAGLIIAAVVTLGGWATASLRNRFTEPTKAPACYWADEAYVPGNQSMPLIGTPDHNGIPNNRRRDSEFVIDSLKAAERVCLPTACTPEAAKKYQSAFFFYLESRLRHMRLLDKEYGDNGLRLAVQIYSQPIDAQFEQGWRDRYQAKLFHINDSRQNRDANAILLFKGGQALRPCRKGNPGS
jgi:hypothetical protein